MFKTLRFKSDDVRITIKDSALWFVAKDISAALEYRSLDNMLICVDDVDKDVVTDLNGEYHIISLFGVLSLVSTTHNRQAKEFKQWLASILVVTVKGLLSC